MKNSYRVISEIHSGGNWRQQRQRSDGNFGLLTQILKRVSDSDNKENYFLIYCLDKKLFYYTADSFF